ncbi:MAG: ATP-binding cassette domain-containing protein [Methanothrix sp.]|nr:ATP-binding cassette domain-containing protein [Methanothrix sp.]
MAIAEIHMHKNPAILTENLTKRYGDLLAVDHISFQVNEGEIFGFLGPNGSGKTSTIRMLVGLSQPEEGRASILGYRLPAEITQAKRYVGVVLDASNLYDELSALDNLLFMARLYGVPRDEQKSRAYQLLKDFGLYERKDDRFGTFSRGMKRALTIAAALIHEPRLLFLDEPTTGLDAAAARSLRGLISRLREKGLTIFLTTHYLEEADLLCDRIAILVRGKIVKIDTPAGLKRLVQTQSLIEFSFARDVSALTGDLRRRLGGAEAAFLDESRVRIYGGDPPQIFDAVFQFSRDNGIGIEAASTIRPSLEDAFLRITGLSTVVMGTEKGGGKGKGGRQ